MASTDTIGVLPELSMSKSHVLTNFTCIQPDLGCNDGEKQMWLKLSGMLINMDFIEMITSDHDGGCILEYEKTDGAINIDESIDEVWAMMQQQCMSKPQSFFYSEG